MQKITINENYPGLHLETKDGQSMYILSKNISAPGTLEICYDVHSHPLYIKGKVKAKRLVLLCPTLLVDELHIDGNIRNMLRASIISYGNIHVKGNVEAGSVIANGNIKVGGIIEAYKDVRSFSGKISASSIFAGEEISAKILDCKKRIFAGISLAHSEEDCYDAIYCEELVRGEICHGTLNPADDQQESNDETGRS